MRRVVMVAFAALLFVPIYLKSRTNQEMPGRAAFSVITSGKVLVKVSGDVRHPGIYETAANSLADSVIRLADPIWPVVCDKTESAKTVWHGSSVNIIGHPVGTSKVTVGNMAVPERMVLGIPLDIASMNEADFDRLPGIGPALAKRIAEYRQNNGGILRVEDLLMVEGIGEKKFEMIRSYMQTSVNTK